MRVSLLTVASAAAMLSLPLFALPHRAVAASASAPAGKPATVPASSSAAAPGSAAPGSALAAGSAAPGSAPASASAAPGSAAPDSAAAAAPVVGGRSDPLLATVDGEQIHASDLAAAVQSLPPELRAMPPEVLDPMLLDQLIDRKVLVIAARREGLDKDPQVRRQIQMAIDTALQNALLAREIAPEITEAAIRAKYDHDIAGKPGDEEVHARHILVSTEAEARRIIDQLNHGAKFEDLAKRYSTDPAAQQGGDLGFFKKDDMLPEFSAAAFALKPGQFTETPVHTRYGWHVIQVIEIRKAKPESFAAAHDELRQELIQQDVRKLLDRLRTEVTIQKYNPGATPATPATPGPPPNPGLPGPGQPPTAQ